VVSLVLRRRGQSGTPPLHQISWQSRSFEKKSGSPIALSATYTNHVCNGVDHAYLQVGGWCQVYEGLTLVTVRGAGHEVPLHRPRQALKLFEHFLRDVPMPKPVESVQSY